MAGLITNAQTFVQLVKDLSCKIHVIISNSKFNDQIITLQTLHNFCF